METKTHSFTKSDIGCLIDGSAQSADYINRETIELAEQYGFKVEPFTGCIDGLRGIDLAMSLDEAASVSHQGQCDADVEALASEPHISAQLDAIGADALRLAIKETGAWDETELADDAQNRLRAVWIAGCDLDENAGQMLSELGDDAVSFLNDLELPAYCSFFFEDNSLFLAPSVESCREDVEFVSSKEEEYPGKDFQGEWLHVNDHGNATLYVRTNGEDKEIWAIV